MALSDLAVYSEYAYAAMTEVLAQQVEMFNAASGGALVLQGSAFQGDFSDVAFFQKISGLVRRRNAYGSGAVAEKVLEHLVDTMVKIAAGTPPIRIDPGQFKWIQQNPEVAGAVLGQQLAKDVLADMLNSGLGIARVALGSVAAVTLNITGETVKTVSPSVLNRGQALFGDAMSQLAAWVMHSKVLTDLYGNALANSEQLFNYGNVHIKRDPFGRLLVMTDSPNLFTVNTVPDPDETDYYTLGLVQGAVVIGQNNDWTANEETKNGDENITKTYQAEWSFQAGIKGFSWDKTAGGKSPNDAAILTATNWDQYATSHKDLAGVLIRSR